jgi:tape measure domain-containing protein
MAKQIASQIATNLTLDTSSARQSLKELTQEVKSSNNEAKILEAQYKASGDAVSASKAKYEGLTNTLDLQKNKIESLKTALQNNNTETQKGKDLQAYLTAELGKAETQLNSYNGQLEKARQSYKYQESGLAELNNELKHSNDLSKARVERLEAEGRTEEANKVKLEQLKTVQKNYTDQLEIQKKELDQLASSGDKNSDSYKRQQLRVEQMGAKLASTTSDIKHFNSTDIKPETKGISGVKDKLTSLDNSLEGTRGHFKTFLGANLIASGITNALQSVQSHISGIFQAGVDYNKQLQNINVGLDNFTNGNSKLSGQLKDIIQETHEASGYALDTTTLLTKKSFGFMGKNVDKAKELSDAWINVGRSTGMSDEKLQASIGTFGKIAASGDITTSSLTKVNKSLPGFSAAMAQHMGITEDKLKELAKNGKLSMEDLSGGIEEMSKMKGGTKGLENYQKTFDGFTSHFEDRYKSLSGKITSSFFSSSNNMLSGLSKSLDGKEVDKAFGKIGDSANKAVNAVTDAFSKVFKGTNTTNLVSGFANNIADSISKLGTFIAKHAGDIKDFFEMIKNAGSVAFGALKSTLKAVIPMLETIFSFAAKHPTTFKVLAGSIIAFNLALKGTLGVMKLFGTVKTALDGMKKGIEGIGTAMKFLKANPLILIITAVVAVGAALYELYKHNKKFRDFVNGIFSAIGDFIGKATKVLSGFIKGTVKLFNGIVDFFKKDWKEILLFIVNPFAGAFALVYKHNDKFKKSVNDLVKSVVNFFKDMGKNISNIFNGIINFIVKTWQNLLKQTIAIDTAIYKAITGAFKAVFNFIRDIFNSIYKTVSKIFNSIKDFIADTSHNIYKNWVNNWKSIFNFFGDIWDGIKKIGSKAINSLKDTFDDVLGGIGKSFNNTWNGIKNGFKDMWDGMKQLAGDGINAVIKIPNAGIDGINGLIHDFGGPKSALGKIPKVKFATGTGAIKELTHAVLNDGNDSPETGNKETIVHPNGKMEIVQGQNTERLLLPGTEILNAKETAMFMGMQGVKHFASGTGLWSSILNGVKGAGEFVGDVASSAWNGVKDGVDKFTKMFDYISGAISDPAGTLKKVFSPKSGGVSSVMDGMAEGAYKKTTDQATDWWKSLWSLAGDAAGGGGSSELLSNAVKFGTGKPYVWGATGPDSFDCSGLVQYTLKQMGKSFPHYSGDQFNSSNAVSDPKAGDLAFFGDGGSQHVGIYSGNGKMFSAMSPSSNPNIGYADVSSWSEKLAGYHRVPGLKSDDDKKSNDNSMTSLIKGQVGGMFDWIKKFIMPTQESAEPAGDGVAKWTADVKKALGVLGLSTDSSMVNKVLKQINTESSGNAKAIGGNDGLADGNATGLMQVKPGTFAAYALSGHNNIMNGYDNILAGLNYAKHRYGDSLSFLGQGHGYANGGLITKNQMIEVGEGDKSEMIIPLDGMKSSRGFELLGKTAVAMAARDGANTTSTTDSNGELSKQIAQTNQLLTGMAQLLQGILGETHASNEPLGTIAVDNLTRTLVNRAGRLQN